MAKKPSVILTLPVDPVAGASAFKPAVKAGTVIVFADNGINGYKAGKDYESIVTSSHYAMGIAAADQMAKAIGGKGKIGIIEYDADYYVTNQRDDAFYTTIKNKYPNIQIVSVKGFTKENGTGTLASAMLTQHSDLDGIYVSWDVAAEPVLDAIRSAGNSHVKVVTFDLGATNDVNMAQGGNFYSTVADLPYDIGYAMATAAGRALLGKSNPPYMTVGLVKVTKDNLVRAWHQSLHRDPPAAVQKALGGENPGLMSRKHPPPPPRNRLRPGGVRGGPGGLLSGVRRASCRRRVAQLHRLRRLRPRACLLHDHAAELRLRHRQQPDERRAADDTGVGDGGRDGVRSVGGRDRPLDRRNGCAHLARHGARARALAAAGRDSGWVGVGLGIGLLNGLITTKMRIPSFLVTLGTFSIISGIARWATGLQAVPILNQRYNSAFGSGNVGSVSTLFFWTTGVLIVGHVLFRHTRFGRHVLATGGNKQAALAVGIRTDRIKVAALVAASLTAAIAGMLYAGRLQGARYTFGENDLLTVIAAVVIGGTSLFGGRGSITGAVVGSLLLGCSTMG